MTAPSMGEQLRAAADRFDRRRHDPLEAELFSASVRVVAAALDDIDEIFAKPLSSFMPTQKELTV